VLAPLHQLAAFFILLLKNMNKIEHFTDFQVIHVHSAIADVNSGWIRQIQTSFDVVNSELKSCHETAFFFYKAATKEKTEFTR